MLVNKHGKWSISCFQGELLEALLWFHELNEAVKPLLLLTDFFHLKYLILMESTHHWTLNFCLWSQESSITILCVIRRCKQEQSRFVQSWLDLDGVMLYLVLCKTPLCFCYFQVFFKLVIKQCSSTGSPSSARALSSVWECSCSCDPVNCDPEMWTIANMF